MRNSFQSVAQTGPLNDTRQSDVPINEAAARRGFIHLGHVANAYKAQFGELPSTTARRAVHRAKTR